MVQLARGGKTMEFLAESLRKRPDEISETAAEVLVSEPAFAETLAKELASTFTFVKETGKAASSRHASHPLRKMVGEDLFADTLGEVRAKNAGPVMDMGRAAHLLMRAMRQDPKLGNRTAILDSLRRVEHSSDPFVSGNAVEALKPFRQANQPTPTSGSQPLSKTSSQASGNAAQQSSSPPTEKASTPGKVTTLIQWVGLIPPRELQALEEKPRLENITVLMQNTVNTVTDTFKGLHDWNIQILRDGSLVTFSCQCPDPHDPLQVRTNLTATWDKRCKEDSRLRREREWATWIKFAELVSSWTTLPMLAKR